MIYYQWEHSFLRKKHSFFTQAIKKQNKQILTHLFSEKSSDISSHSQLKQKSSDTWTWHAFCIPIGKFQEQGRDIPDGDWLQLLPKF